MPRPFFCKTKSQKSHIKIKNQMSNKRQRSGAAFVKGFVAPSDKDIDDALGTFPWSRATRKGLLRADALLGKGSNNRANQSFLDQLDNFCYFSNFDVKGKRVWNNLPEPQDDESWLAKIAEPGQTFDDYVDCVTLRSGKFNPYSNADRPTIYFLPIVFQNDECDIIDCQWPTFGPDLRKLSEWTSIFYDRDVQILSPVLLCPNPNFNSQRDKMIFKTSVNRWTTEGRSETGNGIPRHQTHVNGLLSILNRIRTEERFDGQDISDAFAVIGITMSDLYSSRDDLFIAGMASPALKVAILSFSRYHPLLKMQANNWFDLGYVKHPSNYPYFEDNKKRPKVELEMSQQPLSSAAQNEYLRRAGKLVIHEIAHVFGIDHCIYYHCLMNGTGHLVEDFSAPAHVCGVCLRKLQFRLGFDTDKRYKLLAEFFAVNGLQEEAKWYRSTYQIRQNTVEGKTSLISDDNAAGESKRDVINLCDSSPK